MVLFDYSPRMRCLFVDHYSIYCIYDHIFNCIAREPIPIFGTYLYINSYFQGSTCFELFINLIIYDTYYRFYYSKYIVYYNLIFAVFVLVIIKICIDKNGFMMFVFEVAECTCNHTLGI